MNLSLSSFFHISTYTTQSWPFSEPRIFNFSGSNPHMDYYLIPDFTIVSSSHCRVPPIAIASFVSYMFPIIVYCRMLFVIYILFVVRPPTMTIKFTPRLTPSFTACVHNQIATVTSDASSDLNSWVNRKVLFIIV